MWNNQGGGFQTYDQGGGQGFSSPGGFGTPQQSQEKKRQRAQNIMPVTVAEIINATQNDEKFYSGDIEILQVTFVGLVRTVKETATRLDYEIDDMTGPPIEVKQFVDNDESVPEEQRVKSMRENTYVRVSGTVRSFGGKKSVVAFKVAALTDMNELTHHLLEVVHSHASLASMAQDSGNSNAPMNGVSHSGYGDNDSSGMINGLSAIQNQVHLAIRNSPMEEGASIESVCKQVRGVSQKAVREAIEFLSSEGHIYSTIDDEHFKATDG